MKIECLNTAVIYIDHSERIALVAELQELVDDERLEPGFLMNLYLGLKP